MGELLHIVAAGIVEGGIYLQEQWKELHSRLKDKAIRTVVWLDKLKQKYEPR